ncbi:CRE-TAG-293 protein [Caenorhabditis remanei]|uniref:CRE-TAG-293 protein n=1 Tax=Caenorhabditis remanei TaxID=31234 RepID=E3LHR8_CAERE|nr:CRE-TAG-293 protein [Caenorhabditis remanei]
MFSLLASFILAFSAPETVFAEIGGDLNCTQYNGTMFVWTPSAVVCSNAISDASCAVLYPTEDELGYPAAGNSASRPIACFTTAAETPAPVDPDMKKAAMTNCAKTCGFCCQTDDYNCPNVQCKNFSETFFLKSSFSVPRLNCDTITQSQCMSPTWRTIIAVDCPSACGFCNQGGCVDAVVDCANDRSICQAVGMQDFVNENCQRTCNRCGSSTGSPGVPGGGSCTSYQADSSTSCAAWSGNGFCTNTFYTEAQRKQFCASTCRIC